jgi:hypothetical protein
MMFTTRDGNYRTTYVKVADLVDYALDVAIDYGADAVSAQREADATLNVMIGGVIVRLSNKQRVRYAQIMREILE